MSLADDVVMTVTGPIRPEEMGATLPHEHIFSTFGEESSESPGFDERDLLAKVAPYLERLRALGCGTIVDCTTRYFGRAPRILAALSRRTGMRILTNTGYYGAAEDRYVPRHAYEDSVDRLAERWISEWRDGIEGTGVRPGFIKIAIDPVAPLTEIDRKLVTAALRAHRETGLTIACHSAQSVPATREALQLAQSEGIDPGAWIWVHAHTADDKAFLVEVGRRGFWLELDGLSFDPEGPERHLELVLFLKSEGLLDRVLLSHDGETYGNRGTGPVRPYDLLFTTFGAQLRERGVSAAELDAIMKRNPQAAFTVRVRTSGSPRT